MGEPVCGSNGETFLNECLLQMATCINKDQVTKMSPGRCELDVSEVENEAHFAVRKLSNKFKNSNRWALKDVLSGSKVQDGVHLTLRLQETDCLKTQRSDAPCPIREGSPRRCEITVKNTTRGLTIKKNECNADVVTLCDECPEDAMDIAKYAVKEITDEFEESNEWALQHIEKVKTKVVKGKYIVYDLSLHMTETTCNRGTAGVYSENCLLRTTGNLQPHYISLLQPDMGCEHCQRGSSVHYGKPIPALHTPARHRACCRPPSSSPWQTGRGGAGQGGRWGRLRQR